MQAFLREVEGGHAQQRAHEIVEPFERGGVMAHAAQRLQILVDNVLLANRAALVRIARPQLERVLPAEPDRARAESFLVAVRRRGAR